MTTPMLFKISRLLFAYYAITSESIVKLYGVYLCHHKACCNEAMIAFTTLPIIKTSIH